MGRKPASLVEAALEELCVKYGYCLPLDEREKLLLDPPGTAEAFADAVLVAEGRDPDHLMVLDQDSRELVVGVIRDWLFDEGRGRGTTSGLPRFA